VVGSHHPNQSFHTIITCMKERVCAPSPHTSISPLFWRLASSHMRIDQNVIATDVGKVRSDIANATHVGATKR